LSGPAALALLVALGVPPSGRTDTTAWPTYERVMVPPAPKTIADFELTDQDGKPFKFSSLRGAPAVVMFGFTHCQDICPASLQKLRSFKLASPELRPVRVVMISVDGERDTVPQMKQYLSQYSQEFIGVTGDPERVRDIAARFSAVFFKGQPQADSGKYDVAHNRQVYAIDKSGQLRAEFYDASLEAMQGVMLALLKE
jgi:protein SCO1/2